MKYKILFLVFLIASLLYANLRGPLDITPRHLMAVIMFFVAIKYGSGFHFDRITFLYMVFVVTHGISSFIYGTFDTHYINMLIGAYGVAIIAWCASRLLPKAGDEEMHYILLPIIFIGVFDAIITISQFFVMTWYEPLLNTLQLLPDERLEKNLLEFENDGFMLAATPGIFGGPVYNGYFLIASSVLSFYPVVKMQSKKYLLLPLLFIIASFFCQQRSAFAIVVFFSVYLYKRVFSGYGGLINKLFLLFLILFGLLALNMIIAFSDEIGLRYSQVGLDATGRDVIYKNAISYIMDNPFFTNVYAYAIQYGGTPHNLFLNAYMYGGFISFLSITLLLFSQLVKIIPVIIRPLNANNCVPYLFGVACVGYTMNSLTHNLSIVSGDILIWFLWSGFCFSMCKCIK